jgi:hypothetical protein
MEIYNCEEFVNMCNEYDIDDTPNNFVRLLMNIFIDREPTDGDYDFHGGRLERDEISREDLAAEFAK